MPPYGEVNSLLQYQIDFRFSRGTQQRVGRARQAHLSPSNQEGCFFRQETWRLPFARHSSLATPHCPIVSWGEPQTRRVALGW